MGKTKDSKVQPNKPKKDKKLIKRKNVENVENGVTMTEEGPSLIDPDTVNGGVALPGDSTPIENEADAGPVPKDDVKPEKRKKKASKRKRADEDGEEVGGVALEDDLPPGAFIDRVGDPGMGGLVKPAKKKAKKSKPEKNELTAVVEANAEEARPKQSLANGEVKESKTENSSKKTKEKKKGKRVETANGDASDTPALSKDSQPAPPEAPEEDEQEGPAADPVTNGGEPASSSKKHRFIVFVGTYTPFHPPLLPACPTQLLASLHARHFFLTYTDVIIIGEKGISHIPQPPPQSPPISVPSNPSPSGTRRTKTTRHDPRVLHFWNSMGMIR